MTKRVVIIALLIALFLLPPEISAQAEIARGRIYQIYSLSGTGNLLQFGEMDPVSGRLTAKTSLPDIVSLAAFDAAVDPLRERYYQFGADGEGEKLFVIDTVSGAVEARGSLPRISNAQLASSNRLYGIRNNQFGYIDLRTWQDVTLAEYPEIAGFNASLSAIDERGRRYFVVGRYDGEEPYRLFAVNLDDGEIISDAAIDYRIVHFDYDPGRARLVGIVSSWGSAWIDYLAYIEPASGERELIRQLPSLDAFSGGASLDTEDDLYLFAGSDTGGVQRLYVLDAETGEVVRQPPVTVGRQGAGINFQSFEFNVPANKIYLPALLRDGDQ